MNKRDYRGITRKYVQPTKSVRVRRREEGATCRGEIKKSDKKQHDRPKKFHTRVCMRCGAPGWSKGRDCPAKKKLKRAPKLDTEREHVAARKKVHVWDEPASSADEDDSVKQKILWIKQSN